jgi:hypothetical protein
MFYLANKQPALRNMYIGGLVEQIKPARTKNARYIEQLRLTAFRFTPVKKHAIIIV